MMGYEDQAASPDDLSEQRLQFGQLFLRHLEALGRPFLPAGQPLITAADYPGMQAGKNAAESDSKSCRPRCPSAREKKISNWPGY